MEPHSTTEEGTKAPSRVLRRKAVGSIGWRKESAGLMLDQAKHLKELERESARLKRLVAEVYLERQILKDVAEKNP
jgi:hypothetical protein